MNRADALRVREAARASLRGTLDAADSPSVASCFAAADVLGLSVADLLGVADVELTAPADCGADA
ncbi:MAG: hypothetical protein CME34_18770 [Gordonia sp.]|uniref:hypothetical protein n=1 Tax=Gordonia sp. (in: high G+C Gram-positive bacteria) TaxID=84139 RepID=UPI000C6A13F6|nr:hypothetical protein [Gordonia sp. (in: high G+C Gram-positive bacteria)]MAU83870.1 hypothetical protein [Gordonia sp. (in: high G+C Gram-positive bacteria)]